MAWARQECLCAVLVDGFQADSSWQLAIAVSAVTNRSTHVVNLLVKFGQVWPLLDRETQPPGVHTGDLVA